MMGRRMTHWRWIGPALLTLVASFVLVSCNRFSEPADFTFINGAEPETLDPAIMTGQPEGRLARALFVGLLTRNEKGELVPAIAESWDVCEDGTVYTFHLRENARWSNGDPVTAHDFEYTWKRALDPATASLYSGLLHYIKGAKAFNEGTVTDRNSVAVNALDDRTLRVELNHPTPFFLDLTAFTTLLPVHRATLEKHGGNWIKPDNIVTNWPFTLEAWYMNDRIRLRKNEDFWNAGKPHFDIVDVIPVDQASTALSMFLTGQADLVADKSLVPTHILGQLKEEPWLHAFPIAATYFYRFNCTHKPFDDVRVRQALSLAIDKQRIVDKITKGGEPITGSFTPPGMPGYTPPEGLPCDPEKARQLLSEAGFPGGAGFPSFDILFRTGDLDREIAVEMQRMWSDELGIEAGLRNQEWKVYLNTLSTLDYDVARSSWVGDYNDPNTFLECMLTGNGNNRTGWSNAQYDRLVNDANGLTDSAKRMAMLQEAEKILQAEAPLLPIYHWVTVAMFDPERVGGFSPNVIDVHPLELVFLKKPTVEAAQP